MNIEKTKSPAVARSMECGTVIEPGVFRLETRALPEDAPDGWVLVNIEAVGICGTDYHILEGKHPFLNYPRVIGHELSGRVAESVGQWTAGELVVVNPYLSCNACRACMKGKPNCCSSIEVLGVHRDGGMCSRIAVPQQNLYPATGLTELQAAMVEFLAIGAHAVRRAALSADDRVLVTGAGPIGIGTALFARLSGAEVHLLDMSQTRLAQATEKFGFKNTHLVGTDILSGPLQDGFDVIFDATGNAGRDRSRLSSSCAWQPLCAGERREGNHQLQRSGVSQARNPDHRQQKRHERRLRDRHVGNSLRPD